MPRYDVPRLADYSGAVQANRTMADAFRNLGNQSQDYLNFEEQKRNNQWQKAFQETEKQNETNRYNAEQQEKADTREANKIAFKTLYPEQYSTFASSFGSPAMENQEKMNRILGNVNLGTMAQAQDFNYKVNQDNRDFDYQANRDAVKDNQFQQSHNLQIANANKPTEIERLLTTLFSSGNQNAVSQNTGNGQMSQQPEQNNKVDWNKVSAGYETKPQTSMDIAYSKLNQNFTDNNGNEYQVNPITGRQVLIKSAPTKIKNELNDEITSFNNIIRNSDKSLGQLDNIINNKNLKYATGMLEPLTSIPGTSAKDIAAEIETIKGGSFLSAVQQLKGMGALSDAEGKKLETSIANLNMTQSTEQLKKQLGYIKDSINIAKQSAIEKLKNRGVDYNANQNNAWSDYE